MLNRRLSGIVAALFLAGLSACSGEPPPFIAPAFDPAAISQAAVAEYDKNKNGKIDKDELSASLIAAMATSTENAPWEDGDGALSQAEIQARIQQYVDTNSGLFAVGCEVTLDGRPLHGATVTLKPEAFMGGVTKPASGRTEKGYTDLISEGLDGEGVLGGFYKIEVSKKDASGKETIPAAYNTATTLGCEVSMDMRGNIPLDLRSQ